MVGKITYLVEFLLTPRLLKMTDHIIMLTFLLILIITNLGKIIYDVTVRKYYMNTITFKCSIRVMEPYKSLCNSFEQMFRKLTKFS